MTLSHTRFSFSFCCCLIVCLNFKTLVYFEHLILQRLEILLLYLLRKNKQKITNLYIFISLLPFSERPIKLCELMGKAGMWLIQNIGILNFLTAPPPLPNFEFVGGFHCRPVKTLCLGKSFPSAVQTCFGEKKSWGNA